MFSNFVKSETDFIGALESFMNCPVCGSVRENEYKKCPTCGVDFAVWLDTFIKKLNKKTTVAVKHAKQRKKENEKEALGERYKEVIKQTPRKKG